MAKKETQGKAVPGTEQAKKQTTTTQPKTASPDTNQGMTEKFPELAGVVKRVEEVNSPATEMIGFPIKEEMDTLTKDAMVKQIEEVEEGKKFPPLTEESLMKVLEEQARGEQIEEEGVMGLVDAVIEKRKGIEENDEAKQRKTEGPILDYAKITQKQVEPLKDIPAASSDAEIAAKSPLFDLKRLGERLEELKTAPKTTLKTLEKDLGHNEEDLLKTKRIVASEVLGAIRNGNYTTLTMPHKWLVHVLNFPGVICDQHERTIVYEGKRVSFVIDNNVEDYVLTGERQ